MTPLIRFIFIIISLISLNGCYKNESFINRNLIYCTQDTSSLTNNFIAISKQASNQIFEHLVSFDQKTDKLIPNLATAWSISADKKTYIFSLRENVYFHTTSYFKPSRPLNADDVIFSFNRIVSPINPFYGINRPLNDYYLNHIFDNFFERIEKIDDHKIKFTLKTANAVQFKNLLTTYGKIHSLEYANFLLSKGHPELMVRNPIGTGLFKFKNLINMSSSRYLLNKDYWGKLIEIDQLIIDETPNVTKRYTKLLSGECDIITDPSNSQKQLIKRDPKFTIDEATSKHLVLLSFNTKKAPLKNVELRKAISFAINRNAINRAVYFKNGILSDPLTQVVGTNSLKLNLNKNFNLPLAKRIFANQEFDFNRTITILLSNSHQIFNPDLHKTAEIIKENLLQIGVKSKIESLSDQKLIKRLLTFNYDLYLVERKNQNFGFDPLLRPILSCDSSTLEGNTSRWCSKETQNLLDLSLKTDNLVIVNRNVSALKRIIKEEIPYFMISQITKINAFANNISGVESNLSTGIDFRNVTKKEAK